MPAVRDNTALSRFELDVEGGLAFANCRLAAATLTHTDRPRALRGGIASERGRMRSFQTMALRKPPECLTPASFGRRSSM